MTHLGRGLVASLIVSSLALSAGAAQPLPPGESEVALVKRVPHVAPRVAVEAGVGGEVVLAGTVAPDGRLINARVTYASPPALFNDAALEAMLRYEYRPKLAEGRAVPRDVIQRMVFPAATPWGGAAQMLAEGAAVQRLSAMWVDSVTAAGVLQGYARYTAKERADGRIEDLRILERVVQPELEEFVDLLWGDDGQFRIPNGPGFEPARVEWIQFFSMDSDIPPLEGDAYPVFRPRPPEWMRALRVHQPCRVELEAVVSPRGLVREVKVVNSDSQPELTEAALRAARAWVFKPRVVRGVRIESVEPIEFVFEPVVVEPNELATEVIATERVEPIYPMAALIHQLSGMVRVGGTVYPDGSFRDLRVLLSMPNGVFDASALEALSGWRFKPATRGGIAVPTPHELTLDYNLTTDE